MKRYSLFYGTWASHDCIHIQQNDNQTSRCCRDENYGLGIDFPVASPLCPVCVEKELNAQADTIASLQAELTEARAEIDNLQKVIADSKAYEAMMTDGSDESTAPVCHVCDGKGQLICWRCGGSGIWINDLCPECDGSQSFECQDCEGTGNEHHASVESE